MKNGFYIFKPKQVVYTNEYDMYLCNSGKLVVEVEGTYVYITNIHYPYNLDDVKKLGKLKKRIKL